jgi:hypothetical protein
VSRPFSLAKLRPSRDVRLTSSVGYVFGAVLDGVAGLFNAISDRITGLLQLLADLCQAVHSRRASGVDASFATCVAAEPAAD